MAATLDTLWSTFSGRVVASKYYVLGYGGQSVSEAMALDASNNLYVYLAGRGALPVTDPWFTGATKLANRLWSSG